MAPPKLELEQGVLHAEGRNAAGPFVRLPGRDIRIQVEATRRFVGFPVTSQRLHLLLPNVNSIQTQECFGTQGLIFARVPLGPGEN